MPTAVLTDRERTAVQAYLRLLHTVRAAFGDTHDETQGAAVPRRPVRPSTDCPPWCRPRCSRRPNRHWSERA